MTNAPQIALFLKFLPENKCEVVLGGKGWVIETKHVRHNVQENLNVG
tara:strand:+ start:202 stop:342 length:141 start_codon:yes stop_codon:yes gene_type:complete